MELPALRKSRIVLQSVASAAHTRAATGNHLLWLGLICLGLQSLNLFCAFLLSKSFVVWKKLFKKINTSFFFTSPTFCYMYAQIFVDLSLICHLPMRPAFFYFALNKSRRHHQGFCFFLRDTHFSFWCLYVSNWKIRDSLAYQCWVR